MVMPMREKMERKYEVPKIYTQAIKGIKDQIERTQAMGFGGVIKPNKELQSKKKSQYQK